MHGCILAIGCALAAQNALSIAAYGTRGSQFLALLKNHIINEDITDAIQTHVTGALVGAAPRPAGGQ